MSSDKNITFTRTFPLFFSKYSSLTTVFKAKHVYPLCMFPCNIDILSVILRISFLYLDPLYLAFTSVTTVLS
jgi:hypothetical protein